MSTHLLLMSFPKTICFLIGMIGCVIAGMKIDMKNFWASRAVVFAIHGTDIVPLVYTQSFDSKKKVIIESSISNKIEPGTEIYGIREENGTVVTMTVVEKIKDSANVAIFQVKENTSGQFYTAYFELRCEEDAIAASIVDPDNTFVAAYYEGNSDSAVMINVPLVNIQKLQNTAFTFAASQQIPNGAGVFMNDRKMFIGIITSPNAFVALGDTFLKDAAILGSG